VKKLLLMATLLFCLISCGEFFTGKKITTIDPVTKEKKITYEAAPIEGWVALLTAAVPGLGFAGLAAARLAKNAARARDGMIDANEEAIDNTDWTKINTAESVKVLLNTAQQSHADSKLLAKTFKKWHNKRKIKKSL